MCESRKTIFLYHFGSITQFKISLWGFKWGLGIVSSACETIFNLACILHRIREYLAPALQTKPWRHTIHSGGTRHTGGTVHTDRSRDPAPPGVFEP